MSKRPAASFSEDDVPACKRVRCHGPPIIIADDDASDHVRGNEWVEILLRELATAADMDSARARVSGFLEGLHNAILAESFRRRKEDEEKSMKEELEKVVKENEIWKQGFKTLHKKKEEFDKASQELQQLRALITDRDRQIKRLQMDNYELELRLLQEQRHTAPIPGRLHPDVF